MALKPQTQVKNIVTALIHAARVAGWARVKLEVMPDGSVTIDAGMVEQESADDFLNCDLRMGRK